MTVQEVHGPDTASLAVTPDEAERRLAEIGSRALWGGGRPLQGGCARAQLTTAILRFFRPIRRDFRLSRAQYRLLTPTYPHHS